MFIFINSFVFFSLFSFFCFFLKLQWDVGFSWVDLEHTTAIKFLDCPKMYGVCLSFVCFCLFLNVFMTAFFSVNGVKRIVRKYFRFGSKRKWDISFVQCSLKHLYGWSNNFSAKSYEVVMEEHRTLVKWIGSMMYFKLSKRVNKKCNRFKQLQ